MTFDTESLELHKKLKGKIKLIPTVRPTHDNLKLLYTPGVAAVAKAIHKDKEAAYEYTGKGNTLAIISNGTRLLGLGNQGPAAALPVMEGKALLYDYYGKINALPLCIDARKAEEIITFAKNISPSLGAINIEDIESPIVFDIVETLSSELDIPVFHDDQHGTAIVTVAALLNALKVVNKSLGRAKIVVSGAGSAGYGITKLLVYAGARHVVVLDSEGIISSKRKKLEKHKKYLAQLTKCNVNGDIIDALSGADAFIGVSGKKDLVNAAAVGRMNSNAIVFALSNPDPEILPSVAVRAGASIVATGRSDFENQVNNVLVFPFFMRMVLDKRIVRLTEKLFMHAAEAIARAVSHPNKHHLLPSLDQMRRVKL